MGRIENGAVDLPRGSQLAITSSDIEGNASRISISNPALLGALERGDILHLADGTIRVRVDEATPEGAHCTVLAGGVLSSGKGVNAPGVRLRIEYPTERDVDHLKFGLSQKVDFVAA